jgi:Tfp pilus assembly protein PilF
MERIEKLKEFLDANPADSFVQHALALEYIKLGDDNKARSLFESVLQRDPGYVGSYYHLGKLLERISENDKAIRIYEEGMKAAQAAKDDLSYRELKSAFEELTF